MRLNRNLTWAALLLALLILFAIGRPQLASLPRATAQSNNSPDTPPDEFYRLTRPNAGVVRRNTLTQTAATLPDLDVQYIGRTPRYKWCYVGVMNCSGVKLWPSAGETVTFEGRIANRGSAASGAFTYTWYIDGAQSTQASHTSLAAGAEALVTLPWTWATGAHTVKLVLDTPATITEVSESNNSRQDQTNALTLGIYVEQAVYDYFNAHVAQSDWDNNPNTIDGNSFDDWIQRDVSIWNGMFAAAKFPLTPNGISDRVRIDKIVRIANGALQCESNNPADHILAPVPPFQFGIDFEVDLIWGFTSGGVGVGSACEPAPGGFYNLPGNQGLLDHDPGVLHELGHARYLPDLYGFNVNANKQTLAAAISSTSTTVPFTTLPSDWPQLVPPVYVITGGEIIYCASKSGNSLINCTRGTKATTSRSHASGAMIFADSIYLTDTQGSALIGGAGMPFADADQYLFYLNAYAGRDNMDDHTVERFDEYSAYLWNRIAGKRPICGNYNAPCNINEYFQSIPQSNILQVKDTNGAPLANALVSIYHAGRQCYPENGGEHCIFYGKVYDEPALYVGCTNAQGQLGLGAYPFGHAANGSHDIEQTYGLGSGTLAVEIVIGNEVGVVFLEVTAFNLAYWRGAVGQAIYPITFADWATTAATRSSACRYLPLVQTNPQTDAEGSVAYPPPPPPPTPAPYPAP